MHPAAIQKIVGERYRVVRLIGQGGFGTVVEALDTRLERRVAIKVLAAAIDDEGRERFVREARVMAKVRGDHLLTIYDCILGADGTPFLVMELVDGSLGGWLKREAPVDWPVATEIVTQVARGLETLHRDGSVHGDVKPSNILIDLARTRMLLGDFGLAGTLATFPHVTGTPAYMSPEAMRGATQDARSDLYSLGMVLYEVLTGTRPFAMVSTLSEIFSVRLSEPPPSPRRVNAKLPSALNTITVRLLAVDPADRFQTAAELEGALRELGRSRWWKRRPKRRLEALLADWLLHAGPAGPAPTSDQDLSSADGTARSVDPFEVTASRASWVEAAPVKHALPRTVSMEIIPRSVLDKVREEGEQGPVAWLIVMIEPGKEEQHRLRGTTLVGRDPDCQIMLDNALVSSRHFAVEARDDGFYFADLGSRNGTLLNGRRTAGPTRLHDRDVIQVGSTRLLFIQAATGERDAAAQRRTNLFSAVWQARLDGACPGQPPDIAALAHRLTHDLLREALGYRVERAIPSYHGIAGYMVEAPMLWIRTTRFPILYVPSGQGVTLDDITAQLAAARATDYLAVLVVVPPAEETGREAAELRRLVADSLHRYDLVVLDRGDLERIIAAGDSKTLIDLFVEQGIALGRLSPYVIRGPVPENMFFGREAEIKELSHNVRNHAVLGGRRMGKSSMFLRLRRLFANDPRFHAFYINCEPCFDHGDFLGAFSAALAAPEPIIEVAALRSALTQLAGKREGKTSIFLLDEVDELVAFDARSETSGRLFKTLRALSHEQIGYFVFSGGRTLHEALHDPHSPFFNFCDDLLLFPLDRRSVAEIVVGPMRQLSIAMDGEQAIIDRVYAVTSGHPNLVQYLCHRLVDLAVERRITLAMVEDVVGSDEFVQHFVETAWSQATPLEKLITLLPSEVEFSRTWLLESLAGRGVTDRRAIDSALATLSLYALIQGDSDRLRFVLAHFPAAARRLDVAAHVAAQMMELEGARCSSSTAR